MLETMITGFFERENILFNNEKILLRAAFLEFWKFCAQMHVV